MPRTGATPGSCMMATVINEVDARLAAAFGDDSVAAEARAACAASARWRGGRAHGRGATQALRSLARRFLSASDGARTGVRDDGAGCSAADRRVTAGRRRCRCLYVNGERYEMRARPRARWTRGPPATVRATFLGAIAATPTRDARRQRRAQPSCRWRA